MNKNYFLLLFFMCIVFPAYAQMQYETDIVFEDGEYWWGGVVAYGSRMPYIKPVNEFDLSLQNNNNQVVPLFFRARDGMCGAIPRTGSVSRTTR